MPSLAFAGTEVYFTPSVETENAIVTYIDKAKKTLDIAIYAITNERIAEAIVRARKRGLKVRVLVDFIQSKGLGSRWEYVGAVVDKKRTTMHNKFTIRDGACVATGSFNYTANAVKSNRENLVIICNKTVTRKFEKEFEKLWSYND